LSVTTAVLSRSRLVVDGSLSLLAPAHPHSAGQTSRLHLVTTASFELNCFLFHPVSLLHSVTLFCLFCFLSSGYWLLATTSCLLICLLYHHGKEKSDCEIGTTISTSVTPHSFRPGIRYHAQQRAYTNETNTGNAYFGHATVRERNI
jgi:hypothetical protein